MQHQPQNEKTGQAQTVMAVTPGGGAYPFAWTGSAWSPATGVDASMVSVNGNTLALTTADQRVYTFSGPASGCGGLCTGIGGAGPSALYVLRQIADRNGNTISVTTNAGGDVTQVKDTKSGRYLSLAYLLDDSGEDQYLYGALSLYAHVTSRQTYYYLTDGLGSVLAEVKSDGTNAVSYQYDVYGNVVSQSGSLYDERQFAGEQAGLVP